MTNLPPPKSHIHLIGIGGTGLSSIAYYLSSRGYKITGSELQHNPATDWLKSKGIKVLSSHQASNISGDTKLVVKSAAVKDNNPEIKEAARLKIPVIKYAQALGLLMAEKTGIAVSGTHGKTTTTSLISYLLAKAKLSPSFMVGGVLRDFESGSVFGKGRHFVAEACEYDRSFHHLPAKIKVINNIEPDHMDYYKTWAKLVESFRQFIATTPRDGFVIANMANPGVRECLRMKIDASVIAFGDKPFHSPKGVGWYPKNIRVVNDRWHFEAWHNGLKYGDFINSLPGEHNILNAIVAIIVADILKVNKNVIRKALAGFKGVHRRFEIVGRVKGRLVIDDYGHHPTELKTVVDTARELFPERRRWLIFQPHLYSRTKLFLNDFARVLSGGEIVLIPPIYAARDVTPAQRVTSSEELVKRVIHYGGRAKYLPDFSSTVKYLKENTIPNDLIITVGAGDVWEIGREFIKSI
ncbi:MAG: UDP-N-acetylmuramate--L-alanine ligase [Planctomycetes bacterium]|nr:UDP-N-acetylmuramate--L-alanine ligase [Planctomycetota bacterium]